MKLEELTTDHVQGVLDSWRKNFGFYSDFPLYADTVLEGIKESLDDTGHYENRFGRNATDDYDGSDDAKLNMRLGFDDSVEIAFNLNKGRMTARDVHPKLAEAEGNFKSDVEKIGFRYYG